MTHDHLNDEITYKNLDDNIENMIMKDIPPRLSYKFSVLKSLKRIFGICMSMLAIFMILKYSVAQNNKEITRQWSNYNHKTFWFEYLKEDIDALLIKKPFPLLLWKPFKRSLQLSYIYPIFNKQNLPYVKNVRIRSFSGPYFPSFGLNTEIYSVNLRIQSNMGKIQARKTPNTHSFHAVLIHLCCCF